MSETVERPVVATCATKAAPMSNESVKFNSMDGMEFPRIKVWTNWDDNKRVETDAETEAENKAKIELLNILNSRIQLRISNLNSKIQNSNSKFA
jgi:hypothetical protein